MRWDLFDRLVRFEDNTLSVDYAYDPLGRRIHKYSNAHHTHRPEPGTFVPVAQAMRHQPIRLLAQPNYEGAYDID